MTRATAAPCGRGSGPQVQGVQRQTKPCKLNNGVPTPAGKEAIDLELKSPRDYIVVVHLEKTTRAKTLVIPRATGRPLLNAWMEPTGSEAGPGISEEGVPRLALSCG
jgi:hypothetical protein